MIPSAWCRVGAPLPATNSIPREQDSTTPHPMTSFQGHPVRFKLGDLRSTVTLPHKFHVSGPLSHLDARPLVRVLAKERSWVCQKHLHLASTLITRAKTDTSVVGQVFNLPPHRTSPRPGLHQSGTRQNCSPPQKSITRLHNDVFTRCRLVGLALLAETPSGGLSGRLSSRRRRQRRQRHIPERSRWSTWLGGWSKHQFSQRQCL